MQSVIGSPGTLDTGVLWRNVYRVPRTGSDCEYSRSVTIQIDTAEQVIQTAMLCRPSRSAACHYFRSTSLLARRPSIRRALLVCSRCLLLSPAAAACYICCRRLLCEIQALRSLGFGGHPGDRSGAFRLWLAWSLFGSRSRLLSHVAQNPWSSAQGCDVR